MPWLPYGLGSMMDHSQPNHSPWLIRHSAAVPAKARLFCFHHAGADAAMFRLWPDRLMAEAELWAVQLPGRGYRFSEPLLTDMGEISGAIAAALAPLLDRPFAFFGHSMGSLIGFNTIRELRRLGLPQPDRLIVSGRNAPQFQWVDRGMELLPDAEFVAAVRKYYGVPETLLQDPDLWELWLPRLRADLTISADYVHQDQRPLTCPILVLSGARDRLVHSAGLAGWQRQTSHRIRRVMLAGDHFFLQHSEQDLLREVTIELNQLLDQTGDHHDQGHAFSKDQVDHL